jgi:hypothetical protein
MLDVDFESRFLSLRIFEFNGTRLRVDLRLPENDLSVQVADSLRAVCVERALVVPPSQQW